MTPRPEYPRPQLRRQDWTNLNGEWRFAFDDADVGYEGDWQQVTADELEAAGPPFDKTILVPFCFQAALSGIGDPGFHDVVWYARELPHLPPPSADERLILHFGAVDYQATVWVNGELVGEHRGGYSPFCFDITQHLRGRDNELVVRAVDDTLSPLQPTGKQSDQPESYGCRYTRTTGI